MPFTLPTLKVLHPDTPEGFMIINEDDLTDEHVLHDAKAEKARRRVPIRVTEEAPTKVKEEAPVAPKPKAGLDSAE